MKYIVKNWRQFQHYRDRNPPWIKLHFSMLSSSDWVMLSDSNRVLAIACMLIASRNEGEIDGTEKGLMYMQRVAYLSKKPDLKPLIDCGFLEPASGCEQMLADARPETEKRREETEKSNTGAIAPDDVSEQVWTDYLKLRKGRKAAVTQTAIDGLRREAVKAGLSLEEVMRLCCANGWQGFKADWVQKAVNGKPANGKPWFLESASAIKAKGKELGIPDCEDFPTYRYQVFKAAGITKEVYQKAEADYR